MPNPRQNHDPARLTERDKAALGRWWRKPDRSEPITDEDAPDFVRHTPRWNSLEAIRYELHQAQRKREEGRRGREFGQTLAGLYSTPDGTELRQGYQRPSLDGFFRASRPPVVTALGILAAEVGARDEVQFERRERLYKQREAELKRARTHR